MRIPKSLKKKIIIGTANFGQNYGLRKKRIKSNETKKIFDFLKFNKLKSVDTAQSYNSEKIIGRYKKDKFKIITKIDFKSAHANIDKIEKIILKSFFEFKNHDLDTILFHNTKILHKDIGKKIFKNLILMKKKKYFKKIGVSIYNFNELKYLVKNFKIDVVQCPYNVFDTRLEDEKWINFLKKNKIEIHVRSIFLQGILINYKYRQNKYFSKIKDQFTSWDSFLERNRLSAVQGALNFVLQNKKIDKILIGIENLSQLKDIIESSYKSKKKLIFKINKLNEKFYNPSKWIIN